jgi:hypothetical protein
VDRIPSRRRVVEAAVDAALLPAPRPAPVQLERRAHPSERPAGVDRVVDQTEPDGLGGRVDTGGDRTPIR